MTTTRPAELNNGVWTTWLPVTTAWPSQSACNSDAWVRVNFVPSVQYWPYAYDPAYGQTVANTPTCLPPQATQWWDGDVTSTGTITRYSLGPVVCPAAYSTASTSVVDGTSTSVICCPSKYNFVRNLTNNGGIDGICASTLTSGQRIAFATPADDVNSYTTTTATYTASGLLLAVPVEGYNFAATTTSSTSTTTSTSPTTGTSSPMTTTSSASPPSSTPSSGLATGAKIGIGVGVGGFVLLAAIIILALIFRARKKQTVYAPALNELPEDNMRVELPNGQGNKSRVFTPQSEPQEMY